MCLPLGLCGQTWSRRNSSFAQRLLVHELHRSSPDPSPLQAPAAIVPGKQTTWHADDKHGGYLHVREPHCYHTYSALKTFPPSDPFILRLRLLDSQPPLRENQW